MVRWNGIGAMGRGLSTLTDLPVGGLNPTQRELYDMARQFAENELAPNASKWDAEEIFPVETMRRAAELGFAGIFVREDVGGSVLKRLDGSVIFEALSGGYVRGHWADVNKWLSVVTEAGGGGGGINDMKYFTAEGTAGNLR
jgi:alkylation response protein AidB-like acyl-CoA dehydrogenase